MSKTAKITVVIVVAVVVLGGVWWWMSMNGGNYSYQQPGTTSGASGNSNADLSQNLAQVDGQMKILASDSASVDQGLNDQPVGQDQL
jgi:hypothetical protein